MTRASTERGLIGRENSRRVRSDRCSDSASTERGLIGRENATVQCQTSGVVGLQRSAASSAARTQDEALTTRTARRCFNGARPHRPREPEGGVIRTRRNRSFNGARPHRPRELSASRTFSAGLPSLQRSAASSAARTPPPGETPAGYSSFNGARPHRPRERRGGCSRPR